MNKLCVFCILCALLAAVLSFSCATVPAGEGTVEQNPLVESEAIRIIRQAFADKGYSVVKDYSMRLRNGTIILVDIKTEGHEMAVEFLTSADIETQGPIPDKTAGSRLHVITAYKNVGNKKKARAYLLVCKADDYLYQMNPTPGNRAPVTLPEIEIRLTRDVYDFIAWYETYTGKKAEEKTKESGKRGRIPR